MTKRSAFEQRQRAAEQEQIKAVEASWYARMSAADQTAFRREVEVALAREPQPHADMAPGTRPNPPRPGREPRPPKEQSSRR
ncbi:MAG TPA: hypothetical protein VFL03_10500 [Candidatus Limnocylindrales bacterium]|nr:hypothetical protein [Candidatus Limnocylindrales bacterium]